MSKKNKHKKTFDLTVQEVKNLLPELPLPRAIDPRLPQVPGVCLLVMKVKSGKSNLLVNMMLGENYYGGQNPIFDMIYIISPTAKIDKSSQAYFREELEDRVVVFDDLDNLDPFLRDLLDYQSSFDIKDPDNLPPRVALVFDDISGYLKRNSLVTHLFTRYRHYNLSLWCANQTCRDLPTAIRSQATSLWLSSCYSMLERQKILEEYGDLFQNNLEPVWDDAVKERFNYCYLKLDDIEPRVFKIGKDGISEYDYKNFKKGGKKKIDQDNIDDGLKLQSISKDAE